jgi:hypothetical protein
MNFFKKPSSRPVDSPVNNPELDPSTGLDPVAMRLVSDFQKVFHAIVHASDTPQNQMIGGLSWTLDGDSEKARVSATIQPTVDEASWLSVIDLQRYGYRSESMSLYNDTLPTPHLIVSSTICLQDSAHIKEVSLNTGTMRPDFYTGLGYQRVSLSSNVAIAMLQASIDLVTDIVAPKP